MKFKATGPTGTVISFTSAAELGADNDNAITASPNQSDTDIAFTGHEYAELAKVSARLPQNVYSEENGVDGYAMYFLRDEDAPKLSNVIALIMKFRDDIGVYHYRLTVNAHYTALGLKPVNHEASNFGDIISMLNGSTTPSTQQVSRPPPTFRLIQGGA